MYRAVPLFMVSFLAMACEGRPVFTPAEWIRIRAGSFTMGSPADEPCRETGEFKETQHRVTLTHDFEVTATEVTQGQFESTMGFNPSHFVQCGNDCPVEMVSWHQAVTFCNALSGAKTLDPCYSCSGDMSSPRCDVAPAYQGDRIYTCPGYRLPTEAEWEYACRAGTTSAFYNGPISTCEDYDPMVSEIAWFHGNSGQSLHLAGEKQPNNWGLFDMSGSVWEWVHDWYQEELGSAAVIDPAGPESPTLGRVLRGGSCLVPPQFLRSGSRYNYAEPATLIRAHGFRCVRTR